MSPRQRNNPNCDEMELLDCTSKEEEEETLPVVSHGEVAYRSLRWLLLLGVIVSSLIRGRAHSSSPSWSLPTNNRNTTSAAVVAVPSLETMQCGDVSDWDAWSESRMESLTKVHDRCDRSLTLSFFDREPTVCGCRNPHTPWNRAKYDDEHEERVLQGWARHAELLEKARNASRPVDILFLGSSILEGWMGAYYGHSFHQQEARDRNRHYAKMFGSPSSSTLYAVDLAMAGDTACSLQQQVVTKLRLPDWLEPRLIWIEIGTNDMAHFMCSAETVHLATMQLVRDVQRLRPNVKIVLNSVLPFSNRTLAHDPANTVIRDINAFRSCFAAAEPNVFYFDATPLFLVPDQSVINTTLYQADLVHPSLQGYDKWGHAITDFAMELINARD